MLTEQEIVEQPTASAEDTNATESVAEEQQEPQEGEPKPKGGFQKRIDKLTRKTSELEQQVEHWRNEALRVPRATETPKAPEAKGEPSENDFQTHAEYVKALTKFYATQATEEFKASQRTESAQTQQQKVQQEFKGRQEAFKSITPDFDEVIADADTQVSNAVIAEIVESEHGPELQYYLAKNPDEAERLSKLAPLALAREVGKIESRFSTSQAEKPAKTTSAPPPPNPTSRASSTAVKDWGEASPADYQAARKKGLIK